MATPIDSYGLDDQKTAMGTVLTARRIARHAPTADEVSHRLKANLDHLTTARANELRQEMAQFEAEAGTITFKQYIDSLPDVYADATGGANVFGSFDTIKVTVTGPGKKAGSSTKIDSLKQKVEAELQGIEQEVITRAGYDASALPSGFELGAIGVDRLEDAKESYKGRLGFVGLGGRGSVKKIDAAIAVAKKLEAEMAKPTTGPAKNSFEINHLTGDIYGAVDGIASYAVTVATNGKAPKVSVEVTDSTGTLSADASVVQKALQEFVEFKTDVKKRAEFLRKVYDKRLESELAAATESSRMFNSGEIAVDEAKKALEASLQKLEAEMPAGLKAKVDAYSAEAKTVGETFETAQKYQKVIDMFEAEFARYSQSQMPSATFGLQTLPGKVSASSDQGKKIANAFAELHASEIERALGKDAYAEFTAAQQADSYGHVSGKLGEELRKHKEAFGRLEAAGEELEKEAKGNSATLRSYFATLTALGEDEAKKAGALRAAIPYLEAERVASTQTRTVGDRVYVPEAAIGATLRKGYLPNIPSN